MAAKKQTTTVELEKKVNAKQPVKKLGKEELVKKVVEKVTEKDISSPAEQEQPKEEKKPVVKKVAKKPAEKKTVEKKPVVRREVFPSVLELPDFGRLTKVETEDFDEFKDLENLVVVTAWTKATVKEYEPYCTPNVKTSDLCTIGKVSYDVQDILYVKSTRNQLVTLSLFTEAVFVYGADEGNSFNVLESEHGTGKYRLEGDLYFELYQKEAVVEEN